MKKLLTLFIGLLALGCSNPSEKKPGGSDTNKKVAQVQKAPSKAPVNNAKIQGVWIDTAGEANFDIGKNTIYYPRHQKGYKYSVTPDSLKIFYEDFTYSAKIYFIKDTLVMDSHEFGVSKYTKPKN